MPSVDDRLVSIDRYVAVGLRLPRLDRQRLRRLAGGSIVAAAALSALLFFLSPGAADRTGVRRQVFTDISFNGAPLRDDIGDAINLDFLNDDPDLPRRFFSARWTGFWYVPEAGEVELHGAGDDRLDVWLDGELVIRRTPPADMHTLVRTLRLDAGVHELRVEYEQHGGAFNMRLNWALPGGRARPLPPYRLFHERPDTGDVRLAYGVAWLQRLVATLWIAVIGIALAWLAALVWSRVGPQSTYGPYWASAFRVSRTVFRVAIAGPLGLPASRGTGPSLEDSDPANRGTGGHVLADSNDPRTRRTIAILLGLLFVGHVGVFGWRSVTFDRRVTADSMNYIDVARNLSAGEGLVQSAAGFNQPTFWERDFTPHFPEKTRAGHNPGYSVLIAAVAEVTGLEHADAAFVIGPAAYAAALASAFLFASRLLGPAAGLLAAAFVAHQIRWVFLRTWTEPVVIALLLALLALLARGTTPRRAVVGGLVAGVALLVRSGFAPILALGGLACVLGDGSRVRRLLLFVAGASVAMAGPFLGEGQVYPPQTTVAAGWFPDISLSELSTEFLERAGWTLAAPAFLGACAWWRAIRDGQPIVPDRARYGCVLVIAWITGWSAFLMAARLVVLTDMFDDRMLAPLVAVTAIASALLVWRLCPERLRLPVAVAVFAATMTLATAGDAIVQADTGTAQRLYASSARVLIGRNMTARILPADGDRSDYARRIARSPRRLWVSRNVTARDLVVGAGTMDLPFLFRQQVPATVSFSYQPYFPEISGAKFNAVFLARCSRYDNLYLILRKLRRRWGRFALDLLAGSPTEPGTPAANFARVADLPDSVVFRFTACEG